jgi:hypothetical protein
LIRAAETVANLKSEPIGSLLTRESEVRPLTKLEPEKQREARKLATLVSPNPTAREVAHAAYLARKQSVCDEGVTTPDRSMSSEDIEREEVRQLLKETYRQLRPMLR